MNNPGPQAPQEGATEPQNVTPTPSTGVVGAIAAKLEQKEQAQASTSESGVMPETPLPFDVTKLSQEQLQALKAMLAVTPDQPQLRKQNPTVLLRKIGGKYVVDFKNAYLALVFDPERRAEVEQHKIPVRLEGASGYTDLLWKEFIQADQVKCEVVSQRQEVFEHKEGIVRSRETGLPVEMIAKEIRYFFTVKTPEGTTMEIPGSVANG